MLMMMMTMCQPLCGFQWPAGPKNGSWAHFPVGREKLMPFVDLDRIEQSDRVQAASETETG